MTGSMSIAWAVFGIAAVSIVAKPAARAKAFMGVVFTTCAETGQLPGDIGFPRLDFLSMRANKLWECARSAKHALPGRQDRRTGAQVIPFIEVTPVLMVEPRSIRGDFQQIKSG